MSLEALAKPKTTTAGTGLSGLAGLSKKPATKADLSTLEGLTQKAEESGLGEEANKIVDTEPRLSFLQRLGTGLSAFNPAEAILTGTEEGLGAGLSKYGKGIVTSVSSAVTGKDTVGERRYFKDVAEKLGVENKIAKFGIGFVGDVLLDPSTYFGGALAKGILKGVSKVGNVGLKGIGKIAPATETGLRMAGTGLQDAIGKAFQYGYKASKGATDDVLTFLSKEQKAKLELAASNLDRLGSGVLSKSQREELALKMIAGKRAEFAAREAGGTVKRVVEGGLPDDVNESLYRIFGQLDTAQAGERVFTGYGADSAVKGVASTFPQWISPSLRSRKLFDNFIAKTTEENPKLLANEQRLFDEIADYVAENTSLTRNEITWATLRGVKEEVLSSKQVAREAAKSSDPLVQKTIEEQIARNKQFAEGITDNPYETYFPFIKKDKLQKFVNETQGIKVGSEGYRKRFKNLLTNENMELDPAKAFFTRESQIVSDKMTREFLTDFVGKYGKSLDEFKNSDEAAKAGFQLIKEKGIFGKELGYVPEFDAKLIRDSISPEFQTINMLARATGFDAITSLFKRSVTGLFAPFHIRNFVSGGIQNFETLGIKALNPKNISVGQKIAYYMGKGEKIPDGAINLGGKKMKFSEVIKPFEDRFSGDTFYNADFNLALESGNELKQAAGILSKTRLKETAKTLGLGQEAVPFKVGRAIGQYIEHQQKATAYVTALSQGKTIPQALKLAENAGFDYRALTRFESQIMRRLVPFYSFTRKNIGLQMRTLGENPQRINQVLRFFGNMGEPLSEEEKRYLPEFIRQSVGVKLQDTPEGLKQYVSSFGTPIEAFAQLFGSNPVLRAISQTNPLIKAPIEIGIGKDSFRQRDLKDVYDAREYKLAPQVIKDLLKIKEVQKDILKKDKNGKLQKVGERTAYVADPVRLLIARSLFTSRGVSYLDQVFGNDMQGFVKFLKTTTGIKPQQIDLEAQKAFKEKDQKRELEDLLVKTGNVKQFTRTYEPK